MVQHFEERVKELVAQGYDEENIRIKTGILMTANPYKIEEGGKTNEGVSLRFFLTKSLDPFTAPNSQKKGYTQGSVSIHSDFWHHVSAVPGIYEFLCVDSPNAQGQLVAKPVDVNFKGYIQIIEQKQYPFEPAGGKASNSAK